MIDTAASLQFVDSRRRTFLSKTCEYVCMSIYVSALYYSYCLLLLIHKTTVLNEAEEKIQHA